MAKDIKQATMKEQRYSIEFFHIYTDEIIASHHTASIDYLNQAQQAWEINHDLVVMIDDYNPVETRISHKEILDYLKSRGLNNIYYTLESSMTKHANSLLENLSSSKLKKSYVSYMQKNGKYPCSLLTATWYLTRLGVFPTLNILDIEGKPTFKPSTRIINILPHGYITVEKRALKLIEHSPWGDKVNMIQHLFYPENSDKKIDLF